MKQSPRYNNKMFSLLSMTTRFMTLYVELVMAREVYVRPQAELFLLVHHIPETRFSMRKSNSLRPCPQTDLFLPARQVIISNLHNVVQVWLAWFRNIDLRTRKVIHENWKDARVKNKIRNIQKSQLLRPTDMIDPVWIQLIMTARKPFEKFEPVQHKLTRLFSKLKTHFGVWALKLKRRIHTKENHWKTKTTKIWTKNVSIDNKLKSIIDTTNSDSNALQSITNRPRKPKNEENLQEMKFSLFLNWSTESIYK